MFKRLIRYIRSFFNFSFAEAKGFLLMVGIIAAVAIYYLIYSALPSEGYSSYLADKAILDSIVKQMEAGDRDRIQSPDFYGEENFFPFNPNSVSVDSLMLLGVPARLAHTIQNYRVKGGKFKAKEDLKKIYGFPDSIYQRLEPFIVIPAGGFKRDEDKVKISATDDSPKKQEKKPDRTLAAFDLNQADSLQLLQWKGIGPVLASRIIRFRSKLGGFVEEQQLYEVYGLDSVLVKKIIDVAFIDEGFQPEKIPVNKVSAAELAAHPYISPTQAKRLVEYRKQHGPFRSLSDFSNIHTLDPIFIKKVAPYIRFD